MAAASTLNVLIADRDDSTRSLISDFLRGEGYEPTGLPEPGEAPAQVRGGRYQMVFLDVEGGNGSIDVLRELREVDDDLCVICLTGRPDVETAVATMKHRAFDYVEKPVVPARLRPILQAAVKEHGLLVDVEQRLNLSIGERIRTRRHELGLTLKQVGGRTGLSVSLISQIELGKSAASVHTLYKVATALGVRVGVFFEGV